MNRLFNQKNLSWLNARVGEAEARIVCAKQRLAELESQGLNTGEVCRRLAMTTEYLQILHVRRAAVLEELRLLEDLGR